MHELRNLSREQDNWIERIARPLRRPETLEPGFEARLMAAIRAEAVHARAGRARRDGLTGEGTEPGATTRRHGHAAWRWLFRPRTFSVSPAAGLAVAAGLAAILIFAADRPGPAVTEGRRRPVVAAPPHSDTVRVVQFVFVAPSAERVSLVGDFNNWDPAVMPLRPTRTNGGIWSISVPLSIGRHQYAFIVDGTRWMTDPSAPTAVEDDFGVPNSVVTVGERTS